VTQSLLVADEIAALLLLALNDHFDDVADIELRRAGVVEHLIQGNKTFGLEADVDHRMLVGDLDDGTGDDSLFGRHRLGGVFFGSLLAVEALECLGKILGIVLGLGGSGFHSDVAGLSYRSLGALLGYRGVGLWSLWCLCRDGCCLDMGIRVEGKVVRGRRIVRRGIDCKVRGG